MKTEDLFLFRQIPAAADPQRFAAKVIDISGRLNINPNWLMAVMYFESRLNSKAKNPYSSATGLIQFINSTAQSLGTSTAALYNMAPVEQLEYVYKYLKPYTNKLKSLTDVYLTVFYPNAIFKDDSYVLPFNSNTVQINKIFDLNNDKKITKGEIKEKINKHAAELAKKFNYSLTAAAGAGLFFLIFALIKILK